MYCVSKGCTGVRQQGYALLVVLLVLLVGGTSVYLAARDPGTAATASEPAERSRMLKDARTAVIAYAFSGGTSNQPGALPCVDTDVPGDGEANATHCSSGDTIYLGRLPWKTIDVSRRSGVLWYVIDGDFRDDTGAQPVNVALEGSLMLNGKTGYAALIIEPGDVLSGQGGRPSSDPADYLEGENADGDEVFIDCATVQDCNDRVVGIRVDPLFEVVQRRVLAEIEQQLSGFHGDNGFLPFAAPFDSGRQCASGTLVGRIATQSGSCGVGNTLEAGDFDTWIIDNDWLDHVVYRVAEECTQGQAGCTGADLQLEADAGLSVVLGAAGTELGGQDRTVASPDITDFLDSDENTDGDKVFDDAPPSATDNDILRGFVLQP